MSREGRPPMPAPWQQMMGKKPADAGAAAALFTAGAPPCPSHLDEVGRAEWNRITPELETAGLLCKVDLAALALYCVAYARWVLAESKIRQLAEKEPEGAGLVQNTKNGFEQLSYWFVVSNKAQEQVYKYLSDFGLSPVARARLKAMPNQGSLFDNDPLAAFQRAAPAAPKTA